MKKFDLLYYFVGMVSCRVGRDSASLCRCCMVHPLHLHICGARALFLGVSLSGCDIQLCDNFI